MSCLCNLFYKKKKESTLTRIIKGIPQLRSYTLINTTRNDEYEFAPSLDNTTNNTLCCLFPHITTKIYKTQIPFSTESIPIIHIHTSIHEKLTADSRLSKLFMFRHISEKAAAKNKRGSLLITTFMCSESPKLLVITLESMSGLLYSLIKMLSIVLIVS